MLCRSLEKIIDFTYLKQYLVYNSYERILGQSRSIVYGNTACIVYFLWKRSGRQIGEITHREESISCESVC